MKNKLINLALQKNIDIQILENSSEDVEIEVFDTQIKKYEVSNITTYTIKAIKDNKSITVTSENIKNTKKILDQIETILNTTENTDKDILANDVKIKNKKVKKLIINYDEVKNMLFKLNDLKNEFKSLKSIESSFQHEKTKIELINKNVKMKYKNDSALLAFEVTIQYKDLIDSAYDYISYKDKDKFVDLIKNRIIETEDKLKSKELNSGIYNIVLSNDSVSSLISSTMSMYNAFDIDKKTSILTNKINNKVFSNKFTLIEDPCRDYGFGHKLFDIEGTSTFLKTIVDHGVFTTKLSNNKMAIKENTKSTGNSNGHKNVYLKPGKKSLDELFIQLDNGIYIDSITGLHAGLNMISGKISLQAQGYKIVNGHKGDAIKNIVLVSDIMELFNNIVAVGNDIRFKTTVGAPSLLIKKINITGNN